MFIISVKNGNPIDVFNMIDRSNAELFCRDQSISYKSKKKIMIMLLYCGLIDDISLWTSNTKTIMYNWLRRQRYISGNWSGDYSLKLQCGSNIMLIEGNQTSIRITINTAENSAINYDLLSNAQELLLLKLDDIQKKTRKGGFIITSDRLISTNGKDGIHMLITNIPPIDYGASEVKIQERDDLKLINLYDNIGQQIMSTPLGLLATDYVPLDDEFPDISLNGVRLSGMARIRLFSINFSFDYVDRKDLISILDDIIVPKPRISTVTKKRLSGLIGDGWEVKSLVDEFAFANSAGFISEEDKQPEMSYDEYMNKIINTEPPNIDEHTGIEDDPFDGFFDPGGETGMLNTLGEVKIRYQPAILWDRVENFKYNVIARCCMDIKMISKRAIGFVYKQTNSKYLVYALVYMYDILFTNQDVRSPPYTQVILFNDFLEKFNLMDELLTMVE